VSKTTAGALGGSLGGGSTWSDATSTSDGMEGVLDRLGSTTPFSGNSQKDCFVNCERRTQQHNDSNDYDCNIAQTSFNQSAKGKSVHNWFLPCCNSRCCLQRLSLPCKRPHWQLTVAPHHRSTIGHAAALH
jgi:hypothetical protein